MSKDSVHVRVGFNGDSSDYKRVYISVGDIVEHRLTGDRGIINCLYPRINGAHVEWEDGNVSFCAITSLVRSE